MADRRRLLDAIRQARIRLGNPYAYLDGEGGFDGLLPTPPSLHAKRSAPKTSTSAEGRARELQVLIWKDRHRLWGDAVPQDPVEILEPEIVARYLGLEIEVVADLDSQRMRGHQTAGEFDFQSRRIRVSERASFMGRRFTIAHEIGHFLLHDGAVMHRDRAAERTQEELDADKFAVAFLMPAKLVRERFRQQFDVVDVFTLTTEVAFALSPSNYVSILRLRHSPQELAQLLAAAEEYRGVRHPSLAGQFAVSTDAMANRILELNLIKVEA